MKRIGIAALFAMCVGFLLRRERRRAIQRANEEFAARLKEWAQG